MGGLHSAIEPRSHQISLQRSVERRPCQEIFLRNGLFEHRRQRTSIGNASLPQPIHDPRDQRGADVLAVSQPIAPGCPLGIDPWRFQWLGPEGSRHLVHVGAGHRNVIALQPNGPQRAEQLGSQRCVHRHHQVHLTPHVHGIERSHHLRGLAKIGRPVGIAKQQDAGIHPARQGLGRWRVLGLMGLHRIAIHERGRDESAVLQFQLGHAAHKAASSPHLVIVLENQKHGSWRLTRYLRRQQTQIGDQSPRSCVPAQTGQT